MRTWRVGTISMGLALVSLGVILILSQIFSWQPAYGMLSWWPIILIVLGLEVLVYLFLSKQENPVVKYDLLSIFLVGIISFAGIGLATFSATGLLDKVYAWTNSEIRTLDLPTYSQELNSSIKRVVVNGGSEALAIETSEANDIAVFGTYTAEVLENKVPIEVYEDYLLTEEKGDTLYIYFKDPLRTFNPFHHYLDRSATVVLPDHVEVEIDANHQSLYVNSRTLLNDWVIMNALDVHVMVANDVDITMNAKNIGHIQNEDHQWQIVDVTEEEVHGRQTGTLKLGNGTYMMDIMNTSNVAVMKR